MPERFVSSRACRCAQNVFTCVSTVVGQVAQLYWLITIRFPQGTIMNFTDHHRSYVVMLSEAKHLRAPRARPFAALRVTHRYYRSWLVKIIIGPRWVFGSNPLKG